MRRFFGDKLWIYATLNTNEKSIIISDQRFIIEYETVKNKNGVTIHITRSQEGTSNHSSESQLVELYKKHHFQYHINNNGSLEDLFNECKKFVYHYERN